MIRRCRPAVSVFLAGLALLAGGAPVSAHPLGSATVSRAVAVLVGPDQVGVVAVVDMAEIPAFTAIQDIDADGDGAATDDERRRWAADQCEERRRSIVVRWDDRPLALAAAAPPALSFPAGVGGLETLRLDCSFRAPVAPERDTVHRVDVSDAVDDGRPGWREVTIAADPEMTLADADVPTVSPSHVLTTYPSDLLSAPLDVRAGSALVSATPSVAPPIALDPGQATVAASPTTADPLVAILLRLSGGEGLLASLLALTLSAGLGAAHALSPGHGKALVTASLVGSGGGPRHAIWLAITVAASHTGGVLILGAVVLGAGQALAPDRLLAWLSLAAGACVAAVGASLVLRARAQLRPGAHRGHVHLHGHRHDHGHAHDRTHVAAGELRPRALIGLGLFGGLVPSTSAVIVLLLAVTTGQLASGLALIVSFGLGMAAILGAIALGSAVLGSRIAHGALGERPAVRRIAIAIPAVSGATVLIAGAIMTLGALAQVT